MYRYTFLADILFCRYIESQESPSSFGTNFQEIRITTKTIVTLQKR